MNSADPDRIGSFLEGIAEIGRDPGGGWTRLAYSPQEREAHEHFANLVRGYGADVRTDCFGNTVARVAGAEDLPALATGSHLDTVYHGGNYDGTVGVAAAAEAARIVAESGSFRHPLVAIAFAGEEGARFGAPCIGSRLMTGTFGPATLKSFVDKDHRTAYDCAVEIGLDPDGEQPWDPARFACFVEVHIEQGRVLEERRRPLGIVHSIGAARGSSSSSPVATPSAPHRCGFGATP